MTRTLPALATGLALAAGLGAALAVPAPSAAQDALVPVPVPEGPRPYPYAVLGQQPSGLPGPTEEALEAELGADAHLAPEEVVFQLPAPDGRIFEFAFTQHLTSPKPVHGAYGADAETYDRLSLTLATDVLEGRVLGISRVLRAPNAEVPEYPALRAQLVALYGEPAEEIDRYDSRVLKWAWAEDGPLADLQGQPERVMEHAMPDGTVVPIEYRPCASGDTKSLQYDFTYPRRGPAFPGCVATYTVTHTTEVGYSTLNFRLADHELGRLQVEAADAQLVEWLLDEPTPEASAEPSNMKL